MVWTLEIVFQTGIYATHRNRTIANLNNLLE
jgi:hypothetical protein